VIERVSLEVEVGGGDESAIHKNPSKNWVGILLIAVPMIRRKLG
jgi:hypothetical protein